MKPDHDYKLALEAHRLIRRVIILSIITMIFATITAGLSIVTLMR